MPVRKARVTVASTALLLGLVGAASAIQLTRSLPVTSVTVSLPAAYTIPGAVPTMPWPAAGQASVEVLGIGKLGSSGSTTPVPIASTAKMMTAYVILTDHPLSATDTGPAITVTATDVADYEADVAAGDSAARVAIGEQLTEREALEAMLIPSADNIARMLASWDAGSKSAFVTKMNTTAAGLGMRDTRYTDPSGLDPTTTSTAVDQVTLAEKAIGIPAFAKIVAMKHVTLPVAGTVTNYNSLLGKDGIVGIKTGSTTAAGGCLVFAAHRVVGGHTYTIVGAVLGQDVGRPTAEVLPKVTAASQRIIAIASAALQSYTIVHRGQAIADVRGPLGAHTAVLAGADLTVTGWPGLTYQLSTQISAPRQVPAGATLGTVEASGPGTAVGTTVLSQDQFDPPTVRQRLTRSL
jgi:serine-type D-Ala-D-Ala carboxypeptidase (penicillin-binding protein 5/6)